MSDSKTPTSQSPLLDDQTWKEIAAQLEGQAQQFRRSVELCLEQDLWEPALVLMLSFVDACAWLWRPLHIEDVRRQDFVGWISTYLMPESQLQCSADDLYGARCGLLHSLTGESRLHRENKVPKIFWSRTKDDDTYTLIQLRMAENLEPIGIDIDHLFWAIGRALGRFAEALENDDALAERVGARVYKSYFTKCHRVA